MSSLINIPVGKIRVSPMNVRAGQEFGGEEDEELVESIGAFGMLQPIVVRPSGEGYEVVIGRRRFLSAKEVGLEEVPCVVADIGDEEAGDMSLSENIFRKDLDPVTIGTWIKALLRREGISQSEYARRIGKARQVISEWVQMTDLSPAMQGEVRAGAVTFRDALKVARLDLTQEQEDELARESREEGLDAFKRGYERVAAEQEKRGAPKGLLVVRVNFGLESPEYDRLKRGAEAKGLALGDYCRDILIRDVTRADPRSP